MKKLLLPLVFVLFVIVSMLVIVNFNKINVKKFENDVYSFNYDSTWKIKEDGINVQLIHKKSKARLNIKYRELENYFIDVELKDMVNEIVDGIMKQNEGYALISVDDYFKEDIESYSYLYEKDDEQALVNIYKKDKKLIIIYYVNSSNYFDIVLDSVDSILNSFEIK